MQAFLDTMDRLSKEEKLNELALEILTLSKNTLLVNLRFMDLALNKLGLLDGSSLGIDLATDTFDIIYSPQYILSRYKEEKEAVTRDYLHVVLHCIFQHMYISGGVNYLVWDLASDIAAEAAINDMGIKAAMSSKARKQTDILNKLRKEVQVLSAEKIYRYYMDKHLEDDVILEIHSLFRADSHDLWYSDENPEDKKNEGEGNEESRKEWKEIAERMQGELKTFSRKQGDAAGSLMQGLSAVNRKKYDYGEFLKKFSVYGESLQINDEEFDYVYYTYGLNLYGNMPLVEPLEYKEVKRVREFVIAIDTSASVSGELVKKFLEKTYSILQNEESFFSKINLRVIQCDAVVQEAVKLTSREEFDNYIENIDIKGYGGTDFRPAFEYIDELQRNGEFTNLKGLIYFTDGYGTFPSKKPGYETAFVFIEDSYGNPEVPPWAIKLVLQSDEI